MKSWGYITIEADCDACALSTDFWAVEETYEPQVVPVDAENPSEFTFYPDSYEQTIEFETSQQPERVIAVISGVLKN